MTVRVLLVDDEALLRVAFTLLLKTQPGLEPVGEAADGAEAVRLAAELRPDVVLMDVRMPGMDGIAATARIVRERPATRVLLLTTFDLDEYAFAGLRAGASGFLLKNALPEELLAAIRDVAAGDAVVSPRVTRRLLETFGHHLPTGEGPRVDRLSEREQEVLVRVARGQSNTEIAASLHVAEATVKTHVSRVLAKLELRDRVQIVIYAYENRLIHPS
ncbi:response regulator [Nonomuraea sp. NPDC050556]|uniref:response regulator n=1 Tax=Nonomuraea sp. NPDC050556 TaxID=3364369 RepID=UPI0037AFEBAF